MFQQERQVVRELLRYARPYSGRLTSYLLLAFLVTISEGLGISLFIPLLSNVEEASFSPGAGRWLGMTLSRWFELVPAADRLSIIALCILLVALVRSVLSYVAAQISARIDADFDHELRRSVVRRFMDLELREVERNDPGKLLNTLGEVTGATSQALWTLLGLVLSVWSIGVFTTLLLLLDWRLTLGVAVALLGISIVIKLMTRRVEEISRQSLELHQRMVQKALELLQGQRTIRAYGRQADVATGFSGISRQVGEKGLELLRISNLIVPVAQLLAAILLIVVLLVALRDPANLPSVLVFSFILYRLHPQVLSMDEARNSLVMAAPYIEDLNRLLDSEQGRAVRSGLTALDGLEDCLELEAVCFRYSVEDQNAVEDVSIRIPFGSTVALVGPSGAGKSTLINLILGFYEPDSGSVTVDGVPLDRIDTEWWRSRLAWASQDTYIFNATVRENIVFGRTGASDEEVVAAAKLADADVFITSLSDGYDTMIGDQHVRLSAGQRQRVSLARAIIRNAEVLILDEAINALDGISEQAIRESLEHLRQGRTLILIAHRMSTIRQADEIVVLEAGRVREQGPVRELLANATLLRQLVELEASQAHIAD